MSEQDVTVETSADGLTAGELAYLNSAGEDAAGLLAEQGAPPPADIPAPKEVVETPPAVAEPDAKTADAAATKTPDAKDAKTQAGVDDDDEPVDPKATVSYHRYQRERKKLNDQIAALEKAKADELAAINEKFARGDERLKLLQEALQATPPEQQQVDEDPEPDPNEDILAWANWSKREMGRLREAQSQTSGVLQESAADQRMREDYQRDAASYVREKPDFVQAYNHLISLRAATLEAQGYAEPQIRQILNNEERGLVQRAVAAGKRPSAMIYDMAQRMGYTPWAAQPSLTAPDAGAAPAAPVNGTPPVVDAKPKEPSVVEEIERIQRGQEAGKTLSGTGGGGNELTVEALANMSERQFEDLYKAKKGQIDALLGSRRH